MEVFIDNRSGQELPLERIKDLANFVVGQDELMKDLSLKSLEDLELSISFVDTEEITALNSQYRNKFQPTDILSFEMDDDILLGDIVINPDVAKKHASIEELSLEEELWVLVIHGTLHLLGYDHMEPTETKEMEELEDKYFTAWLAHIGSE